VRSPGRWRPFIGSDLVSAIGGAKRVKVSLIPLPGLDRRGDPASRRRRTVRQCALRGLELVRCACSSLPGPSWTHRSAVPTCRNHPISGSPRSCRASPWPDHVRAPRNPRSGQEDTCQGWPEFPDRGVGCLGSVSVTPCRLATGGTHRPRGFLGGTMRTAQSFLGCGSVRNVRQGAPARR
jgi:hypothetical protein